MAVTIDGNSGITSPDFEPSSSTTPTNGLFLPTTNTLAWATNSTERLRLDASGNLGIGVTPGTKLDIGSGTLRIKNAVGDTQGLLIYQDTGDASTIKNYYSGPLILGTNNTERMRLDSSGNFWVGTAVSTPGGVIAAKSTTASTQVFGAWNAVDSGNAYLFYGGTGSASFTGRYQIYWNFTSGTGTAGFLSDYRQKDNVRQIVNGLDTVNALKPSIYRFKDAAQDASGFIAHEVQAVIPQAVSGHKDEVDEDGNPKYQMLDQVHIIPYLTAAIQELTQRLEKLENKNG